MSFSILRLLGTKAKYTEGFDYIQLGIKVKIKKSIIKLSSYRNRKMAMLTPLQNSFVTEFFLFFLVKAIITFKHDIYKI